MPDISSTLAGIKSPNPFWLASAPPTNSGYQVMKAFDAGWGGAVWKTLGVPVINTLIGVSTIFLFVAVSGCSYQLESLEIVNLEGKSLTKFPKPLKENKVVKEILIGTKGYTVYPPFSLVPNQEIALKNLPIEIDGYSNLKKLTITASQINDLPETISNLKSLEFLDLSFNKSLELNNQVKKIASIEKLDTLVLLGLQVADFKMELKKLRPDIVVFDNEFLLQNLKNDQQ
jgi:Leucine-rich repeat (LRR) protein